MRESKQAIGYLLTVFVLGVALGSAGTMFLGSYQTAEDEKSGTMKEPENDVESAVKWLGEELNFSPDQKKQLMAILSDVEAEYKKIWEENKPRYEVVRMDGRERIRKICDKIQIEKFEDILKRLEKQRGLEGPPGRMEE